MALSKRKAVFNATAEQLDRIREVVSSGRYRSASEFLREAIDEKLHRVRDEHLQEQVASYVAEGHADEDRELPDLQAFEELDGQ